MGILTELICLREISRPLRRNPRKYFPLIPTLYFGTLLSPRKITMIRHGYAFIRHVDDVLDGDLDVGIHPLEYASHIRRELEGYQPLTKLPISRVLNYFCESYPKGSGSARRDLATLVGALVFDNIRAKQRRVLSEEDLREHYRNTFFPLNDLTLGVLGSELTASKMPVLTYGQAHWQLNNDLRQDWKEGRINIPREVLDEANLSPQNSVEEVRDNVVVKDWIEGGLEKTLRDFKELNTEFEDHSEFLPRLLISYASGYFIKQIERK